MPRPSKTLIKLEERNLQFEFNILQIQFNKSGNFYLKLSIQNKHRQDLLSKITVEVNENENLKQTHIVKTDSIKWDEFSTTATFENSSFKFSLPQGFCKNDGNYDVYLLIEAFGFPGKTNKHEEKMGEASFAIYPRTELPRANLFARKGEDYYRYSGVLTLLRPFTRSLISMHCGRLSYSVAFYEFRLPGEIIQEDEVSENESEEDYEEIKRKQDAEFAAKVEAELAVREAEILQQRREKKEREMQELLKKQPAQKLVVDRTTQWTPQEMPFNDNGVSKPHNNIPPTNTFLSEDSFHISIASSPIPDDISLDIVEKTMDTAQSDEPMSQPGKTQSKSKPKSQNRLKSPTMTSPPPQSVKKKAPNRHVASPGCEQIYVIMHGASSLPSRSDGSDPQPFATLKSAFDEKNSKIAQTATHSSLQPTHAPTWEETLSMEVSDLTAEEEEMILTVADSISKEKLVTFRIPVKNLIPFHPYHFELVQPTKFIPSGIRVYATVVRKKSYLPRLRGFQFCGLEVDLRSFQRELSSPVGPLLAVARIVPDYTEYKETMLTRYPSPAGITTTTVNFPSPHPSAFEIPKEQFQGFPQIATPSSGGVFPKWDHFFMFSSNDTATMFTHNSALVIEYYPAISSMSSMTWSVRSPVGFSTLLLDEELFDALISDAGQFGVRIEDLLIQACDYETLEGAYPSVKLILRLIKTERPDTLAAVSDPLSLPSLDTMPIPGAVYEPITANKKQKSARGNKKQNEVGCLLDVTDPASQENSSLMKEHGYDNLPRPERKRTVLLVKEDEYPPSDILETILPEYAITENDKNMFKKPDRMTEPVKMHQSQQNYSDNDPTRSLLNHQSKELENYRDAMKRMAGDIVALRNDVANLQNENSLLRSELARNRELGNVIKSDLNTGVITTDEVADKYVSVRQKLNKETDELKKYKEKVQLLQNQLIKANDKEKNHLKEAKQFEKKEDSLQRMQDKLRKMKRLEETCIQQEKVIQKMEKLLDRYTKPGNVNSGGDFYQGSGFNKPESAQVSALLTQENIRLRNELEMLKVQEKQTDAEKLQLLARVERAESRVLSLENQLEHNSRRWAKERHELTIRLQEHRNGFLRTDEGYGTGYMQDSMLQLGASATMSDISSYYGIQNDKKSRNRTPTPFVAPISNRPILPMISPHPRRSMRPLS